MGKLEKLIVLTVLFAAAVVLAVSLNRGKEEGEASDPLSGARDLLAADAQPEPYSESISTPANFPTTEGTLDAAGGPPTSSDTAPSLLLHAGAEVEPAPLASAAPAAGLTSALRVEPESDPSRPILLERQGLRPSFMDEYMMYTVVEGDTWSSLAQRFYQDGRFTRNLHLANEDLSELVPGKDILVPVFDLLAVDSAVGGVEGSGPAGEQPGAWLAAEPPDQAPTQPIPGTELQPGASVLVYEVHAGDTLSDISLAALGTSTRWTELLELNGDTLKKPEDLRVGMKLRLPAGAKIPAVAKPAASKPQPKATQAKPKTSQAGKAQPTAATSAKKRKVL